MMNYTMFNSVTGDVSSKRVMGITYMTVALVLAIADQFTKYDINSYEVWLGIVVTGASLLGISLFEYYGKITKPGVLHKDMPATHETPQPPATPKNDGSDTSDVG